MNSSAIPRGRGLLKAKIVEAKYDESKLEEGRRVQNKKTCRLWHPPSGLRVLVMIFHLILFSITAPVGWLLHGWFLLARLSGIQYLHALPGLRQVPGQHLRHQFPSSSIGDEFKASFFQSVIQVYSRKKRKSEFPQPLSKW